MPRSTKFVEKGEWLEFTLRLTDGRIRSMLVDISIDLGWSLDSCARRALAWFVDQHGKGRGMSARVRAKEYPLAGGHEPEVARRKPETLRRSKSLRIALRYPPAWSETLDRVVGESMLHNHIAPLWREAIVAWAASDDVQAVKDAASAA